MIGRYLSIVLVAYVVLATVGSAEANKPKLASKYYALTARENPDLTVFTFLGSKQTVFSELPIKPWEGRQGTAADASSQTLFFHGTVNPGGSILCVFRLDLISKRFDRRDIVEIGPQANILEIQPFFHEKSGTLYEWMIWEDNAGRFVILGKVCFNTGKFVELARHSVGLSSTPLFDPDYGMLYASIKHNHSDVQSMNSRIDIETGAIDEMPDFVPAASATSKWIAHIYGWNHHHQVVKIFGEIALTDPKAPKSWAVRRWMLEDGALSQGNSTFSTRKSIDSGIYDSRSDTFIVFMSIPGGHEPMLVQICAETGEALRIVPLPTRYVQLAVI